MLRLDVFEVSSSDSQPVSSNRKVSPRKLNKVDTNLFREIDDLDIVQEDSHDTWASDLTFHIQRIISIIFHFLKS